MSRVSSAALVGALLAILTGADGATAAPPNDECSAATVLTAAPLLEDVDMTTATVDPTQDGGCGSGGSVWYTMSPSEDRFVNVDVSGFTYVAGFTGSCDAKTSIGCQTFSGRYLACAGTPYLFKVARPTATSPTGVVTVHISSGIADDDHDGVGNCTDNCPNTQNPGQEDTDGDGVGNACDRCEGFPDADDPDHDARPTPCDNCPTVPNFDQNDFDADGVGDACDDGDGDGRVDGIDNCRTVANADQRDDDHDGAGNACDPCTDFDGDGFGIGTCAPDNCPYRANPDQADADSDGIGDACVLCGILGEAAHWSIAANYGYVAKARSGDHVYSGVSNPVCTGRAYLADIGFGSAADLVVLATSGTAVRFAPVFHDQFGEDYPEYRVSRLITGGGEITGLQFVDLNAGPPDTSGTHPRLAECQTALGDAVAASDRLAALPPTQVFGDIKIGINEEFTIDATGGGVIAIKSLNMAGGATAYFDDHVPSCSTSFEKTSHFTIVTNTGDQVLLNIGKLRLGNCARLTWPRDAIVNMAGKGGTAKIGVLNRIPVLLAPQRNLAVLGAADDFNSTIGATHVRRLTTRGNVRWTSQLPCH